MEHCKNCKYYHEDEHGESCTFEVMESGGSAEAIPSERTCGLFKSKEDSS